MGNLSKANQRCLDCGSSDGMAVYSDGSGWCFSCSKYFSSERVEEETGFVGRKDNIVEFSNTPKNLLPMVSPGAFRAIPERKISLKACQKFGITVDEEGNYIFPHCDPKGNPVAQLIRTKDNPKGYWRGDHKKITLFGQQLYKPNEKVKTLTLVVGHFDTPAVFDMMGDWPVMSIPNGDNSALKYCKENFEELDRWEKIVLAFDSDEPGQKAAQEVSQLFMKKAYLMRMPAKDPNDCLKEGKTEEFKRAWWGAQRYMPESIEPLSSLRAELFAPVPQPIAQYPWKGLNEKTMGMRAGEMVVIKAPPKTGKTSFLAEIAMGIRKTSESPIGMIYLEETPRDIILRLASIHLNKPLHFPQVLRTEKELQEAFDYLTQPERFHYCKHWGSSENNFILSKVRDFTIALDCQFTLYDHVSMTIASEANKDERVALDQLVYDLKKLTIERGANLHMVTHVNDDGKPRGSRVSLQACNILLDMKRDILAEDRIKRNTTDIIVEANRPFGLTGKACSLFYDVKTGRMTEIPEAKEETEKKE